MTTVSLREAIDMGLQHHLAGRLTEAESIYVQIINAHPQQAEAIHLLGVINLQRGNFAGAIDLINRAIDLQPHDARFHSNLGQAYAGCGLIEDAINAHRRALSISPDMPEALNNLGNALQEVGKHEEAVRAYQRALRNRPDFLEAHNNLGNALKGCGKLDEAIKSYEKALSLKGDYADAWSNLGSALLDTGQDDAALAACQRAVALKPDAAEFQNNLCTALRKKGDYPAAIEAGRKAVSLNEKYVQGHSTLGVALLEGGQTDAAIETFRKAIELFPNFAEGYSNLGNAHRKKGENERALEAYRKSIELKPDYVEAHANLAKLLHTMDRYEEAVDACRRALELRPGFADVLSDLGTSLSNIGEIAEGMQCYREAIAHAPQDAIIHYNFGLALLLSGDYRGGWPECEWRWLAPELDSPHPRFNTPRWEGTDLNGRHLLLFAEQGFGDTIQFSRFAALAAQRGEPVTLLCQPELVRLVQSIPGVRVRSIGEGIPPHDVHHALLSLPLVFDTTVETIPAAEGYLKPDIQQKRHWEERVAEYATELKIGLVWAGRQHPDPKRSIPPELLSGLSQVQGARFISLQKPLPSASTPPPPPGVELIDFMSEMHDFADTAALIANLDLVITVDTAIAHLSGAMGKPVWILLPFLPDWRWMLEREDSPWYRSARLFRQPARGNWQTPVSTLLRELKARATG